MSGSPLARHPGGRRGRTVVPVLVALLALVAASCGARLTDEQVAAIEAGEEGDRRGVSPEVSDDLDGGDDSTRIVEEVGESAGGGGSADSGTPETGATGPVASPDGGGGRSGPAPDAGPSCSGGGGPGLTDEVLTVGNVSTLSGILPGFAQTAPKAVQAYANLLNSQGGVCGRRIEVVSADDRGDSGQHAAEIDRLKDRVFAFVGGFSPFDGGGVAILEGTDIAKVAFATSVDLGALPNVFNPIAGGSSTEPGPGTQWAYMRNQGLTKAATITVANAAARTQAEKAAKELEQAGFEVVLEQEVSETQFDWSAPARAIAESGAEVLMGAIEVNGATNLMRELDKIGYELAYPTIVAAYGERFIEQAGEHAEGVVANLFHLPFEDGRSAEPMAEFLDWWGRTAPGEHPDFIALYSWVSAKLFFDTLAGIDGELTRDSAMAALGEVGDWNADGLIRTGDIARGEAGPCFVLVRVQGGEWVRETPSEGFRCEP